MRVMLSTAAVLLAIACGGYFGLLSCGGRVWHEQAFAVVLGLVTLGALLAPAAGSRSIFARALVLPVVGLIFFATRAVAASFYPAAPESWSGFFGAFRSVLEYGPC